MPLSKTMVIILFVIVIVLFVVAVGIWWRVYFGTPNPPLPSANVSIASSSSSSVTGTPTGTVSGAYGPAAGAATNSAENPELSTEDLSVDGAMFTVEIASTSLEQTRGLSFRTSLGANDGMLFIFSTGTTQTFWMKDMNFALDMIWISGNTVDGFTQNIPAPASGTQLWELPIYPSPANTDKVLEVNAGTVAKYNIKVGDSVTIGATQ